MEHLARLKTLLKIVFYSYSNLCVENAVSSLPVAAELIGRYEINAKPTWLSKKK